MQEKYYRIWKTTPRKDKWEYFDVVPLLTLLGVNHHLPLLHMCKTFVYINCTEKRINQFEIG